MQEQEETKLNPEQSARRRLLAAAVYTPPAILGTMMVGPRHALGAFGQLKNCTLTNGTVVAITISSGTNACCPCIPNSTKFNAAKCSKLQCVKSCASNTAACTAAGGVGNINCKDFCKEGPPGCTPPPGCKNPCVCTFDPKKGKNVCK
jgi:hypothetical protein